MGTSECSECGYSGQRNKEEKTKETSYVLGFVNFSRNYSILVCPECGHEENVRKNSS